MTILRLEMCPQIQILSFDRTGILKRINESIGNWGNSCKILWQFRNVELTLSIPISFT